MAKKSPGVGKLTKEEEDLIRGYREGRYEPPEGYTRTHEGSDVYKIKLDDWAPRVPEAIVNDEDSLPFDLHGSSMLVISDLHIPFHSPLAISQALRAARRREVNTILLNGDIIDNYRLSDHEKERGNKLRNWKYELDATTQFLTWLREDFPHCQIYYKFGNHEDRFDRRMMARLPELDEVEQFTLQELMKLTSMGIVFIPTWRIMQYGELYIAHGHELRAGQAIPGRNVRLKAHDNILVSHVHRTSEDPAKRIGGSVFAGWSIGCLCDLHPKWLPVNQWNWGYAVVEKEDSGQFHVENMRIL